MKLADSMSRLGGESAFDVLTRARALESTGRSVIHLEIGEPDFATPPHIVEPPNGRSMKVGRITAPPKAFPNCARRSHSTFPKRAEFAPDRKTSP